MYSVEEMDRVQGIQGATGLWQICREAGQGGILGQGSLVLPLKYTGFPCSCSHARLGPLQRFLDLPCVLVWACR